MVFSWRASVLILALVLSNFCTNCCASSTPGTALATADETSILQVTVPKLENRSIQPRRDAPGVATKFHEMMSQVELATLALLSPRANISEGVDYALQQNKTDTVTVITAVGRWLKAWLRGDTQQAHLQAQGIVRPPGSDIWNASKSWISIQTWHPAGVVSNVRGGIIFWAEVSYIDLNTLLLVSVVAYPAFFLMLLYVGVIIISACLGRSSDVDKERLARRCYLPGVDDDDILFSNEGIQRQPETYEDASLDERQSYDQGDSIIDALKSPSVARKIVLTKTGGTPTVSKLPFGEDYAPPILAREDLNPFSQAIYAAWVYFCCTIPCFMVFGMPSVLTVMTLSWPQEVYTILSLLVIAICFSNGIYMVIFAVSSSMKMREALTTGKKSSHWRPSSAPSYLQWIWPDEANKEADTISPSALKSVHHWVIIPQYKEDIEIVSAAIKSISESPIARTHISILLAMEERDMDGKQKAERMRGDFQDLFEEVCISYHPANLPNDPPGKASNLKWAADCLLEHLWECHADLARIIVTVSDADSDFHSAYFETLSTHYLETPPSIRNLRIWQSSMLHIKNYYQQPMPVIVGTMFTTMQELSIAGDPNSIAFPYSTYSLSLELVRRVGGWDAEWIAEDWHMGIKCYLLTFGSVSVEPIFLPTINYTPEDDTWFTKCLARWTQAKRHALGFSDLSYYFMMLPLIFAHALSKLTTGRKRRIVHLRAFFSMWLHGVCVVIRLVNVHVVVGVMATYGVLNGVLRLVMMIHMGPDRHIHMIWKRTEFCVAGITVSTAFFMGVVTLLFHVVFGMTKHRVDEMSEDVGPLKRWIFKHVTLHWLYTGVGFLVFGPVYFLLLGVATWRAAIKMITSPVFEYEVASKPKPVNAKA